jgi:hypothetical protein
VVAPYNTPFLALGKWLFGAMKRKASSCNIVSYSKIHMCAQYRQINTNYAVILAITLVIRSDVW